MPQITIKDRFHIPRYDNRETTVMGLVEFDYQKCSGCEQCVKICPASAITIRDKNPVMVEGVDNECMACADCMAICKEDAIKLVQLQCFSGKFKTIDRGKILPPRL